MNRQKERQDEIVTLRTKLEMAEARCKSALDLYEGYHDTNVDLRAELAAVKQELRDAYRDGNNKVDSLYTENTRLKERCEALEGLVEALTRQADVAAQSARFALHSSWENEQYRGICQTVQTARAKLAALGSSRD